jgi:hypothetical protein
MIPYLRGWPQTDLAPYNAGAPASVFDQWNDNETAGVIVAEGGQFTIATDFSITTTADTAYHAANSALLWRLPNVGGQFLLFGAVLRIDAIGITKGGALSGGFYAFISPSDVAKGEYDHCTKKQIPETDGGWSLVGAVHHWVPDAGAASQSAYSVGAGSIPSGAGAGTSYASPNYEDRIAYGQGQERNANSAAVFSLHTFQTGATVHDRFIVGARSVAIEGASFTISGRAYLVGVILP